MGRLERREAGRVHMLAAIKQRPVDALPNRSAELHGHPSGDALVAMLTRKETWGSRAIAGDPEVFGSIKWTIGG